MCLISHLFSLFGRSSFRTLAFCRYMAAEESRYDHDSDEDEDKESNGLSSGLDPSQYGENTPVKAGSRPQNGDTWQHIKRLMDPALRGDKTHVCLHCMALLNLTRDMQSNVRFQTSRGKKHMDDHHPGVMKSSGQAPEASGGAKKATALFASSGGTAAAGVLKNFSVSKRDLAMAKAALHYTYGGQRTSKRTFDDKFFCTTLQAYNEAGGGVGPAPFVTANGLRAWVLEEFKTFKHFLTLLLKRAIGAAQGNPPAQGLHDCATLKNHVKCIAVGIEIVDPDDFRSWSIAVAMVPIESGSDMDGHHGFILKRYTSH